MRYSDRSVSAHFEVTKIRLNDDFLSEEGKVRDCITRVLPNSGPYFSSAAIDDCALSARQVVEDAALDERVYARVAEQDQRGTIIVAARNLLREMRIKPRQRGAA